MSLPRLVFATRNPGKVKEIAELLDGHFDVIGLDDIGCHEDVPETADTIEGNAIQKAEYVKEHYGVDCFADDTGLEVNALGGAPGVYTARYAGPAKDAGANMDKLIDAAAAEAEAAPGSRMDPAVSSIAAGLYVCVCGPEAMVKTCKDAVRCVRMQRRGVAIGLHVEEPDW